ncbi:hypothetical protein BCY91_08585 [Pelobium manganitolerans]|uniref:Uncharacterized protein n=1 Tax=Pelobium manganitolerans TaxID=1842495 RepID=A0A419S4F4_9SPHI|nr:hypothetical protein [Pelobium manganitolerans]RKD14516.1 hypothetical protein BCY91_08585 [Pelobium manganitolerans]
MAKQIKPTTNSTGKTSAGKSTKPEADPKSKSKFNDEDDDDFDMPIDDLDGFDDLSYDEDDDY